MIYFRTIAEQPFLKGIRILSDVMGQSHKLSLLFRSKRSGKMAGQRGSSFQMFDNRLFPMIF